MKLLRKFRRSRQVTNQLFSFLRSLCLLNSRPSHPQSQNLCLKPYFRPYFRLLGPNPFMSLSHTAQLRSECL
jgi:hypothetical protein